MIDHDERNRHVEKDMVQLPNKRGRKPRGYKQWPALLRPDQIETVRHAATERGRSQGNALFRDIIDFWHAHQGLFTAWLAKRGKAR